MHGNWFLAMIARLVYSPVMRSGDTLAPRHLLLVDNLLQDYGIREQVLSGFGSSVGAQFLSFFFVCLFVSEFGLLCYTTRWK